jgi:hypothetical protein
MECVLGECVCPSAHYHLALDPSFQRQQTPNHFVLLDDDAPAAYTEPYWTSLTVRVYLYEGATIGFVVLGIGISVLFASVALALWSLRTLKKQKIF